MLNKKMKKILAVALCGMMTIAAVPMLSVKAEDTTDTNCASLSETKMSESSIWPDTSIVANSLTDGWKRVLTDTEDGLRITWGALMDDFSHCTTETIALDGAHMRLTFHVPADADDTANTCDASKTFGLTIGTTSSGKSNNSWKQGLNFKIQVATGQLYCSVDGVSIDHSGYEGYNGSIAQDRIFIPEDKFDRTATTVDIKTSVSDSGDFVLNLNGYEFTVAKEVWESSIYMSDQVFFKLGTKGKILDCTWNFLHNDNTINNSGEVKDIDIYLIAGQSNAAGCSTFDANGLEALDSRYVSGFSNVLYAGSADGGNTSKPVQRVKAGLGMYNYFIGPELGMAKVLSETCNETTDQYAGVIKFALGGTSLVHHVDVDLTKDEADWVSPSYEATLTEGVTDYTGALYDGFLAEVEKQLEAYTNAGFNPVIKGMYWMQGEEDRYHSEKYPEAFQYFASDIRNDLTELAGYDLQNMPIVMGLISETCVSATAGSAGTNQKFIAMQKTLPEQVCNLFINDSSTFQMNKLDENGNNVSISSDKVTSAHWKWQDVVEIGNMVGEKLVSATPTHVADGEWLNDETNHWQVCKCGESEVELAEHTPETVNAKDATVDEEGYTGDKVCSVCKYVMEEGTVIEKLPEDDNAGSDNTGSDNTGSDNTGNTGSNNTTNTGSNSTTNTGTNSTTNAGSNNTTNTGANNTIKTGDNTSVALYLIVMLVCCAGIVVGVAYNKRESK